MCGTVSDCTTTTNESGATPLKWRYGSTSTLARDELADA